MNPAINQMSDLELALAQSQLYKQLMGVQSDLLMVEQEINKRTSLKQKEQLDQKHASSKPKYQS